MHKVMFTSWILFGALVPLSAARAGGSSYSSNGYGLTDLHANTRSTGMGRLGIAVPSGSSINLFNPAALMGLNLVRMDLAMYYEQVQTKTSAATANSNTVNVNHGAFAIPFGTRLAMALSVSRYTKLGYDFAVRAVTEDGVAYEERFTGSGGAQVVGFTVAGKPADHWSAGLSLQYVLGSITRAWNVTWDSPDFVATNDVREEHFYGMRWTLGGLYQQPRYTVGGFLAVNNRLTSDLDYSRSASDTTESRSRGLDFPAEFGLGVTYLPSPRWLAGMDFVFTGWKSFEIAGEDPGYRNTFRISVGAERAPSAELSAHYLQTLHYRIGAYYQTLYARNPSGHHAGELFLTWGMGIPVARGRHTLDLGFELGTRGTISTNEVRETVFRLTLAVSGGERWFQVRKRKP